MATGQLYWGSHQPVVVCLGILVHIILTYSVIDIHFQTPVVRGVDALQPNISAPAERVVLIVADGLRADKFFSSDKRGVPLAPFLKDRGLQQGAFGVSHTRPPTESRPGHVAIAAGFYEDPSALLSGWKVNPVEFDSIFNHTLASWGFGAPDVVPIFQGQGPYIFDAYPPQMEDFSADDLTYLDAWVFDKSKRLIDEASLATDHPLRNGPAIIFLHLLGLDSNGHAHGGPSSQEYLDNIRFVDRGIQDLSLALERAFPDGKTTYVFTADHGMTEQASHGDGAPENTETPLVLWGPGIQDCSCTKGSCWGYNSICRVDIEQAQIAPLVAVLLGVSVPVNALFHVPTTLLREGGDLRAQAAWNSAHQLVAAYGKKAEQVEASNVGWSFKPYLPLQEQKSHLMLQIENAFSDQEYGYAERLGSRLAQLAVEGLLYLQQYDGLLLKTVVLLAFLGWMGFLATQLLGLTGGPSRTVLSRWRLVGAVLVFLVSCRLVYVGTRWTYYLYMALPVLCWAEVFHRVTRPQGSWNRRLFSMAALRLVVSMTLTLVFVLGISVAFSSRQMFFFLMCIAGCIVVVMHPWVDMKGYQCCISFAVCGFFTLLPLTKKSSPGLACLGCWLGITGTLVTRLCPGRKGHSKNAVLFGQIAAVIAASILVWKPPRMSSKPSGSSMSLMQVLSWVLFAGSPLMPLMVRHNYQDCLLSIFLGFLVPITVVSISWEPLFYCCLGWALWSWQKCELGINMKMLQERKGTASTLPDPNDPNRRSDNLCDTQTGVDSCLESADEPNTRVRPVALMDIPDAVTFLLLINVGFFGQGNAASVASFDIASVYRLTTVFNPFLMGGILVMKNLIPLILVTCVFTAKLQMGGVQQFRMCELVVLLSDAIALRFFFLVRSTGSWAEIGMSLGCYGIMNAQVVIVLALFAISHIYTGRINTKSNVKIE